MYNVEKYIGECLNSLLCQTFKDFEVIIVDDCSTDDSINIVKGYRPKFQGHLKIVKSEKNSGCCAIPRNMGMPYAIGKYIFFLDSDDLIVKDAFEKLYSVAENFDADVVQCEKFYTSDTPELKGAELTIKSFKTKGFVQVPTLDTDSVYKRLEALNTHEYIWMDWSRLIRRKFILENKIEHPPTLYEEDLIFMIYCLSCAKHVVRFPDPINIYRYRPGSVMHRDFMATDYLRKWFQVLRVGFAHCDKFLSDRELYKQHPELKYFALDIFIQEIFNKLVKVYKNYSAAALDDIIREELRKNGDNTAMSAFFFNMSMMYSMQIGTYLLNKNSQQTKNSASNARAIRKNKKI